MNRAKSKRKQRTGSLERVVALSAAAILFICSGVLAQDYEDYEYEPGEGLHQEEWYDPSDWFDTGEGIDYEADWEDYSYGYDVYEDLGYPNATYYPYDPHHFYYPEPWAHDPAYYQYSSEKWYKNDPFQGVEENDSGQDE